MQEEFGEGGNQVFRRWTSIVGLHNVKAAYVKHEDEHPFSIVKQKEVVKYKAKVKLHGLNAAVNINNDGVAMQGRTDLLQNPRIMRKAAGREKFWQAFYDRHMKQYQRIVVFGELCGPDLQDEVALTKLKHNIFCVYAIQLEPKAKGNAENMNESTFKLMIDPEEIEKALFASKLPKPDTLHILPWYRKGVEFPLNFRKAVNAKVLKNLNSYVDLIEEEDPWVKDTFGIKGGGEGLVCYPVSLCDKNGLLDRSIAARFMFKAKVKPHRTTRAKKAASMKCTKLDTPEAYVKFTCTNSRYIQGAQEVSNTSGKSLCFKADKVDQFVEWMVRDIQKEAKDELEVSSLKWEDVRPILITTCRNWYLKRCS